MHVLLKKLLVVSLCLIYGNDLYSMQDPLPDFWDTIYTISTVTESQYGPCKMNFEKATFGLIKNDNFQVLALLFKSTDNLKYVKQKKKGYALLDFNSAYFVCNQCITVSTLYLRGRIPLSGGCCHDFTIAKEENLSIAQEFIMYVRDIVPDIVSLKQNFKCVSDDEFCDVATPEILYFFKGTYDGDINDCFTADQKKTIFEKSISNDYSYMRLQDNGITAIVSTIIEQMKNILTPNKKKDQTLLPSLNQAIFVHTNDNNKSRILSLLYNHTEYTDFKTSVDLIRVDYNKSVNEIGIDTQLYDLQIVQFIQSLSELRQEEQIELADRSIEEQGIKKNASTNNTQKILIKRVVCSVMLIGFLTGLYYFLKPIIKDFYDRKVLAGP